ncbi:hypothetical protein [Halomontanus rarus]|uniref:hypothetical protein n=1 Tax=Halomontanus rarus TaxID=3034020 RepID=UPI00293BA74F|nr:hypothetical protein [Halovivax sp. KZCA124]
MGDQGPENTIRERVGNRRDRYRLYVLLDLNRLLFTVTVAVGIFVCFLLLGAVSPFRRFMLNMAPTRYMFQALVGALITGVTLVVTITQLVLSQELGPIGAQRERMSDSMSFRGDVEDIFGSVSPPEPESFLQALIDNTREKAETFEQAIGDHPNSELTERVTRLTDDIAANANIVIDELEDRNFGEYAVVKSALDYNYSWKIYQARRIRAEYSDEFTEEQHRALIELLHILSFFGPAREYIKSLYFQWALVDLSRNIIYTTIPALVVTGSMALYLRPTMFAGTTLGIDNLVWVVSIGVTAGLFPFLLLSAYILRLATITQHTLAIGSFILRSSERSSEIKWE